MRDRRHGGLGESAGRGRPVLGELRQRLPATPELTPAGLLVATGIAVPPGVLSAAHRDTLTADVGGPVGVGGVLSATAVPDPGVGRERPVLSGEIPSPINVPAVGWRRPRRPLAQAAGAQPVREAAPGPSVARHPV